MQRQISLSSSIVSLSDCSYIDTFDTMLEQSFEVKTIEINCTKIRDSRTRVGSPSNSENSSPNDDIAPTRDKDEDLTKFSNFDILCGRSKLSHRHKGNKRFRLIIEMNRERYQNAANRADKTRITFDIIDLVRNAEGRFLKWDSIKGWQEASEDYTREKVSHALRSAKDPAPRAFTRKKKDNSHKLDEFSVENNAKSRKLFENQQEIMMRLMSESEGEETGNS